MRFISLFSKYMTTIYRCISVVALLLVSTVTVFCLIKGLYPINDFRFYINIFTFALLILSVIFPAKIEFIALVSFVYSVEILILIPLKQNCLSFMLYILTCAILFSRGYFRKKRFLKVGSAIILFFALFASQLRFGLSVLIESIIMLAEFSFSLFLILLFYYLYLRNQGKSPIEKILDLSQFTELSDRDMEWIELILQETKYSTIANQYNLTEGTVKNRMRFIFKTLDVSDRIGFMATYGGFQVKKMMNLQQ